MSRSQRVDQLRFLIEDAFDESIRHDSSYTNAVNALERLCSMAKGDTPDPPVTQEGWISTPRGAWMEHLKKTGVYDPKVFKNCIEDASRLKGHPSRAISHLIEAIKILGEATFEVE